MQKISIRFLILTVVISVVLSVAAGCSLFDSENDPPETETTSPTHATTTEPATSTEPKGTQINLDVQGYLTNEDKEIVDIATLTAQGTIPLPSEQGGDFTHMEVNGLPAVTEDDTPTTYTTERKNGILELEITLTGNRRNAETGKIEMFREVKYSVFIDQSTLQFLMCIIDADQYGTTQRYYFIPTMNTQVISDTLMKAYTE